MWRALSLLGTLVFAVALAGLIGIAMFMPLRLLTTLSYSEDPGRGLLARVQEPPRAASEPLGEERPAIDGYEPQVDANTATHAERVSDPVDDHDPDGSAPDVLAGDGRDSFGVAPDALLSLGDDGDDGSAEPTSLHTQAAATPVPHLPITRVELPEIGIDAEVVVSPLVEVVGGVTWEVPAFKVGHAERTGGAGAPGNAVLLGHVTSRSLGNVFERLHRSQVGDVIRVYSGDQQFEYRVLEVKAVFRSDVWVLEATPEAFVTLITCTGRWLPDIHDYEERLVVRGELVESDLPVAAGRQGQS